MPSINMVSYYPAQAQPAIVPLQPPMVYAQPYRAPMIPYTPPYAYPASYARPPVQTAPQITYIPVYSRPDTLTVKEAVAPKPESELATEKPLLKKSEIDALSKLTTASESDKSAENALARVIMQYAKTNPALRTLMTTENILQLEKSMTDPNASLQDLLNKFLKEPLRQELHAKGILGFFRRQSAKTALYSVKRFMNKVPMTQSYREQLNAFFDDLKQSPSKASKKQLLI